MELNNKKILITGGAGFIGSNLALTLQIKYPDNKYFVVDNFSSGNFDNLMGFKGKIITEDIFETDLAKYFDSLDVIFHQAAVTDSSSNKIIENNIKGFKNVLEFAIKSNAKLIYASSASVYGRSQQPWEVGKNEVPTDDYGESKLAIDNIAREHFDRICIIGLRYFPVSKRYNYLNICIKDAIKANLLASQFPNSRIFNVGPGKYNIKKQIKKTWWDKLLSGKTVQAGFDLYDGYYWKLRKIIKKRLLQTSDIFFK